MKIVKLKALELIDFMGLNVKIQFDGKDTTVSGDNREGKTRLATAWNFLFTGKDCKESTKFQPLFTEKDGTVTGKLATVIGTISVDDVETELSRSIKKTKGGTKSIYQIDGIDKKLKEFDAFINGIFMGKFSIFSNIFSFNALDTKEMRKALLEIADNAEDGIILKNKKYDVIRDLILKHSADDLKSKYKSEINSIKSGGRTLGLDEIEPCIKEVEGLKVLPEESKKDLTALQSTVEKQIEEVNQKVNDLKSGNNMDIRKQKAELETRQMLIKNDYNETFHGAISKLTERQNELQMDIRNEKSLVDLSKNDVSRLEKNNTQLDVDMEKLRAKFHKACGAKWEGDTTCPTCHQDLPVDQVEKIKADFNNDKAEVKKTINARGAELTKDKEINLEAIEAQKKSINERLVRISTMGTELSEAEKEIADIRTDEGKYQQFPEFVSNAKKIVKIIGTLESSDNSKQIEVLNEEKEELEDQILFVRNKLQMFESAKRADDRIKELKTLNNKLSGDLEAKEYLLSLVEDFEAERMAKVEESVNSLFVGVQFKLFEVLINGNVRDICKAMIDGIPFHEGTNRAGRINAGMEIVQALQDYYNIQSVVFVDDAEAVSHIYPIDAQVIKLFKPTVNPPAELVVDYDAVEESHEFEQTELLEV